MTKDYAKKKRPHYSARPRGRKKERKQPNFHLFKAWLGGGLAMVVGILIAFEYPKLKSLFPQKKTMVAQVAAKPAESPPDRRFDFYTVLPNNLDIEGNVEDAPIEAVAKAMKQADIQTAAISTPAPTTTPNPAATPTGSYIVQLGSFRSLAQAEQLKAELALSGSQARIQTFNMGSKDTRHRVYIGPFESRAIAEAHIKQLSHSQARHSLVVKNNV